MPTIEQSIVIDVPVRRVYDQWTHFEEFPRFMDGVESVRQIDDRNLHWRASIAGRPLEWDAVIVEQVPDRSIAWRSLRGPRNSGVVTFSPLDPRRTRVTLILDYDAFGMISARVLGDLRRFKEFIEGRPASPPESHGPDAIDERRGQLW